jgi:uncharacterized cysteine cluster protein YcgN (CxxCxxCC family)
MCCRQAVREHNTLYILPSLKCQFLTEDNLCSVYEERHKRNPYCTDIKDLPARGGGVPPKCNYKDDYDFPFKTEIASPKKERKLIKKLKVKTLKYGLRTPQ